MATFFLYVLKSTICLALFYLGFKALMSNETFFRFNRWVLLAGLGVCLVLPLIKTETDAVTLIQEPVRQLERIMLTEEDVVAGSGMVPDKVPAVSAGKPENSTNPYLVVLWTIYLAGCSVCFIATLLSFCKMAHIIRCGRKITDNGHTLILSSAPIAPFSWGKYIILSEEDYRFHPDEILTHEYMHLHHRHSIDLVYMEILLLLHWFNPAVWLLKRELREIHEFQADDGVLKQGIDATKYQLLLVKKAVGSSHYTLANSFNHSKIKKRITMMLRKKSNNWARLKLLLLVPVGLVALNAFADPITNWQTDPPPFTFVISKDTVNQLNTQVEYEYILSYGEPNSTDTIAMLRKSLYDSEKLPNDSFGKVNLITIRPRYEGVPIAYLEKIKKILEGKGKSCKIETTPAMTKPVDTSLKDNRYEAEYYKVDRMRMNPEAYKEFLKNSARRSIHKEDFVGAKGRVVASRGYFKDRNGGTIPASPPLYIELTAEQEKKLNTAPPPPPPPPAPMGSVKFTYKDGSSKQFTLYGYHADSEKNLEGRIRKIYNDSIQAIQIHIDKNAPNGLLDMVNKALDKEIPYKSSCKISIDN